MYSVGMRDEEFQIVLEAKLLWDQCCRGWKNTENDQDTGRSYSSLGLVHINVKLIIHCTYLYLFCVVSSKIINMKRDYNKIMMHEYINQLNCKSRYFIFPRILLHFACLRYEEIKVSINECSQNFLPKGYFCPFV